MEIPIITTGTGPVSMPTSLVTSIGVDAATNVASGPTKSSKENGTTGDSEIVSMGVALTLYDTVLFGLLSSLALVLMADIWNWGIPPLQPL